MLKIEIILYFNNKILFPKMCLLYMYIHDAGNVQAITSGGLAGIVVGLVASIVVIAFVVGIVVYKRR